MRANPGELTAVTNREVFERTPGGVDAAGAARWADYRAAYHRAQGLDAADFPLQLDFELNSTCQMRCNFCVHGQETVKKVDLPFETFARVIDEGARHGLCSIKLNYINEPLLRRDLPRFVRYAKSRGVLNVYFATNGLLLTEDVARDLVDAGLSKVMVSLDAVEPATFKLMRRSSELPRIEANVLRLIQLRRELGVDYPAVRVNFLRTRLNADQEVAFVEKWKGVADSVSIQTQVALPGMEEAPFSPPPEDFRCSFPFKLLVVDCRGDILPCCTFNGRSMPLGNIETMTVAQAWASPAMMVLRGLHAAGRGLTNPVCAHCILGAGK